MAYKKCKWLAIKGKRFTVNDVARCEWPLPDYPLPVSIAMARSYQQPVRVFVGKSDCAQCPCFEQEPPE